MASQPARPWFRLSSLARPAGPGPTPISAPAPSTSPAPAPAPQVRPTSRPLAPPPPAEPTPPAPAPTPPSPAAVASAQLPPLAVTSTTASVPSSPARGIYSAPSAASLPGTSISITSSVPSSPGNKVTPSSTSGVPSPRNRIATSLPNSPASRAVPPPQTSPPKPTTIANLVPQQTYSPPKSSSTTISSATSAQEPSANYNPSPRTTKPANNTPPQSPSKLKPTALPPSPLKLPPSQLRSSTADQRIPLEAEQKTGLVQKTIDQKPNSWFSTGGSKQDHDFNSESQKTSNHGHHAKHEEKINRKKLSSDSEVALGMRIITLAGENKGACMELIRSPNKHHEQRGGHSHFLHKKGNNGKLAQTVGTHQSDKSSSSSGDEGKPKMKDKIHRGGLKAGNSSQLPLSSFTNSNVQGINNSILYNSSCTHHDPGVHLALTRKPNGDGFNVKSHVNGHHSEVRDTHRNN